MNKPIPWRVPASEEMKRYPELKEEKIKEIREWISTKSHLPQVDDESLCQFIHACYYDMEKTKSTMEFYYTYKNMMPHFSKGWDLSLPSVKNTGDKLFVVLLPGLDNDNNQILVCKLNHMKPSEYIFSECIKWIMMTVFLCTIENGIRPSYTIVYDADGYTMSHVFRNTFGHVKDYVVFGQNASNIRVTGIKFINSSPVVKRLIQLAKPFLNRDVLKLFAFHTNYEEYFKTIPKEIVPSDYGGDAPSLEQLHEIQKEKLMSLKEELLKNESICADESQRLGTTKEKTTKGEKKDNIENTFKKLELD